MTRLRPGFTWLAFALCLTAVAAAMVWMSVTMLRQERAEFESDRLARQLENERLALWRMESALVPLISQENSRPHFAYRAFYSLEVFSKWFSKVPSGEIQFPSELMTNDSPYILIHFEIHPDGRVTSPQVPTGNMRDVAEVNYTTHEAIEAAERRLSRVKPLLSRKRLLKALSIEEAPVIPPKMQLAQNPRQGGSPPQAANAGPNANAPPQQAPAARNVVEFQKRRQASVQVQQGYRRQGIQKAGNTRAMKAVWIDDGLILARETRKGGKQFVQGCVLNWPHIRRWLKNEIADLLPGCRLVPVKSARGMNPQAMLASVPVRLEAGEMAAAELPLLTPMRLSLGIAWLCFLLATFAVAWLLLGAMRLSERRGAFVSAVTHELRTPLTTFRMYTEMLSRGMVTDAKRAEYVETLHKEADRLGHLVENVLSYARLESPKKRPASEPFSLNSALDRMRESLERRAEEAGMTLDWQCNGESDVTVRADSAAVERIVFNLVDNACKYARNADDRQVHIACTVDNGAALIRVRDHGPGVSPEMERRMFLPFAKSDCEAANTAPGVGLGLSLSRGLARRMGGDLRLKESPPAATHGLTTDDGACFELSLPLCSE